MNNTTDLTEAEMNSLVQKHLTIWNEKDATKRLELMKNVYAPNIEIVDSHLVAIGYEKINAFINMLQEKNPQGGFTPIKPVDINHNIARIFWENGTPENPAIVTGMDLLVFEQGKAAHLYVFVDIENKL
ncbi:MAG: hypothetical protein DI598_13075 [Pseudopedobacter saltans]|uniref:SnoaL-like domain-containing protein n=1 Tax=Pseudopedobacter saltans TaxID=151895 RepID=A0A2W5ESW1_9SPHI|nr:MAG: hypothetical protein DI598_13075 [Pseudopedobacter saltans]